MTPEGRAYVLSRLSDCPDLAALAKVWGNLGFEYQRDPQIQSYKDKLKEALSNG